MQRFFVSIFLGFLISIKAQVTPKMDLQPLPKEPTEAGSTAVTPDIGGIAKVSTDLVNSQTEKPIHFNEFIREVQDSNLNYAAQKFNVPIAEAQISLARLWPNPTINGGYNTPFNQGNSIHGIPIPTPLASNQDLPKSITVGISQEIPLGGKLGARESVATTALRQAEAQLQDFFRTLRGTAASAYIDALNAQLNLIQLQKNYKSLQELSDLNDVRYKDGAIAKVDMLQARVAALEALSALHAAESTLNQANIGLAVLTGRGHQTKTIRPLGNLLLQLRVFSVDSLVKDAIENRSDILAAMRARENALAQLKLTLANRVPDITASLNYTHNTESQNAYAPSVENDQIGFSLSMALPFSNFDQDDLKAGHLAVQQTDTQIAAAKVQAETDVRQAIARYEAAVHAVKAFSNGILQNTQEVLDIKTYSYKKGEASLLDVRQAESDLTATYQNYFAALDEQAKALVNLEQMTGFWDLDL